MLQPKNTFKIYYVFINESYICWKIVYVTSALTVDCAVETTSSKVPSPAFAASTLKVTGFPTSPRIDSPKLNHTKKKKKKKKYFH